MARRNKCKQRIIPPQNRKICGSICFCQLVIVFSSVSLIYLTVAVYIPSYKAFISNYEPEPVMCQTINTSDQNNCSWASCGEWCLTKTSGFCPQIHVTARQNGTKVQIRNCTTLARFSCPFTNPPIKSKLNCNNGSECSSMDGVYNCTLGHCLIMSRKFLVHYKADGAIVDSIKDNGKLTGYFECKESHCVRIKKMPTFERICPLIYTSGNNIFVTVKDDVFTTKCEEIIALDRANGSEPGEKIQPTSIWNATKGEVVMMSCDTIVSNENNIINATDCVNGTIYNASSVPSLSMNFTVFWALANQPPMSLIDEEQNFVPMQSVLTIYNSSRLFINLDGCVNTLKGECKEFLKTHGGDGRNQTAQSRFTCFYKKNFSDMVVSRYDLEKTWNQLIIAISVPSVLFVCSFITLCAIMHSVRVGDDTKMRCKYCIGTMESEVTRVMKGTNSKYEFPEDPAVRRDEVPLVT